MAKLFLASRSFVKVRDLIIVNSWLARGWVPYGALDACLCQQD